ncbi:hypothetical protein HY490_01615 [Candidatus Woesearchaeota archaeon]|nr:hypothetical protein [Candidatus Woesearchaeota archaeon]
MGRNDIVMPFLPKMPDRSSYRFRDSAYGVGGYSAATDVNQRDYGSLDDVDRNSYFSRPASVVGSDGASYPSVRQYQPGRVYLPSPQILTEMPLPPPEPPHDHPDGVEHHHVAPKRVVLSSSIHVTYVPLTPEAKPHAHNTLPVERFYEQQRDLERKLKEAGWNTTPSLLEQKL